MAGKIALGIPCEVCGNDSWWDNRVDKKNPKGPDYKCAGSGCKDDEGYPVGRWEKARGEWGKSAKAPQNAPPAAPRPAGAPKGGRLTPDDTTPDERGERVFTWEALAHTYAVLTRAVVKGMVGAGLGEVVQVGPDKRMVKLDHAAVQAGVATLLIQGEKAHIPLLVPRKVNKDEVAKPAPKKELPPEIVEEFEDDGSLPWP